MSETTGGGESGIRASDAERDATVQRLSAATGDGRLTLEEFSQRMEQATAARTRAELDSLVTDLPADTPATAVTKASTVTGVSAPAPASWHVSPIGGLTIRGPWRIERHVIGISVIGGMTVDLSQAQLAAPEVTLTDVSLIGGARVNIPPGIRVQVSGFSLVGGTTIDGGPEPGPGAPIVRIRSFSIIGGTHISRRAPSQQAPLSRHDRQSRQDRWERRAERRHRRRDRF